MNRGRVLILDGMWNKSLAVVRSFGKKGFFVSCGEKTRLATALFSRYCSKRFIYPSLSGNERGFLDSLENELRKGAYDIIIATELSTQLALVSNRDRLSKYCKIPFADPEKTMQVQDKAFLMRYAEEKGFETPKTFFIEDIDRVNSIDLAYPLIIKPRISSGSRGIAYVYRKHDLAGSYAAVHKQYPFPIIQECLPQESETYGVGLLLNSDSDVRASFAYRRLRTYPVKGGPSTLRESVKRDDVREIAGSLLKSLGWTGIAHVEFKIDPKDGRPKLLEINPRFWGSLELAVESGVDFPYLLYRMAMEGDVKPVTDYKAGVRCRWLIPGDLMHFLHNPERFRLKPDFFDFRTKDDIISLTDPLPTIGRISSLLTFLYDKEMRRLLNR